MFTLKTSLLPGTHQELIAIGTGNFDHRQMRPTGKDIMTDRIQRKLFSSLSSPAAFRASPPSRPHRPMARCALC